MLVTEHKAGDVQRLRDLMIHERSALQRDRYRAVLLAVENHEGDEIAKCFGRSPRFVDEWIARYRSQGLPGLIPKKSQGHGPS